jgi:uncharacterized damage-inducible protein DinB
MAENKLPEPWLRGLLQEVPAVQRAVLHALELAKEDVAKWCGGLTDEQMNARPCGLAPVAFHLRHIARSLDRLLTYAENKPLTAEQITALKRELDPGASRNSLLLEFDQAIRDSELRVRAFDISQLEEPRMVGIRKLSTTVAGLLVHVADHTQRHVGQAITTARIVTAQS